MTAFATDAAAEARAAALVADGTWINAHGAETATGAPCVRVQRPMSAATSTEPTMGAWVEITDDATA